MEIKVFQNAAFGTIRTMQDEKGEPLFCAKDVAEALGYKLARKAVHDHVEKEDVLKRNTPTSSGEQVMLFVNESGLYALILSSKLPKARNMLAVWKSRKYVLQITDNSYQKVKNGD